jgi:hypothetical protein
MRTNGLSPCYSCYVDHGAATHDSIQTAQLKEAMRIVQKQGPQPLDGFPVTLASIALQQARGNRQVAASYIQGAIELSEWYGTGHGRPGPMVTAGAEVVYQAVSGELKRFG